jgi:hypothetical protein
MLLHHKEEPISADRVISLRNINFKHREKHKKNMFGQSLKQAVQIVTTVI